MAIEPCEPRLTPREAQVVSLVAEGYLDKEIARLLRIKLPTVKALVHTALQRTRSRNRAHLAVRFVRGELAVGKASRGPRSGSTNIDAKPPVW